MDVLTNEQYISYDKLSRYQNVPVYFHTVDNKYTCGMYRAINRKTNYQLYTIKDGDSLDSISLKFYGTAAYYWIIADFNKISDCFVPLVVGAIIAVPTLSAIEFT